MFAVTQRLLLRPGWSEDAPALFAAIADALVGSEERRATIREARGLPAERAR